MAKAKKASGGTKKAKDPNAPKRAMSAFFFWMQENRERLKKPGMGVADVAKAAGEEWAKLTDKSVSFYVVCLFFWCIMDQMFHW